MNPRTGTPLGGVCKALYCLDVARSIDLRAAEECLTSARRTTFHHKTRVLEGGMPPPLRLHWDASEQPVGPHSTSTQVEVAVFDQGALCITWSLPFETTLDELVRLSVLLYDNAGLIAASRELAQELMAALAAALDRPRLASHIEDYVVFEIASSAADPEDLLTGSRGTLARILRAEERELSSQEVDDALANPVSYGQRDVCLVDWLAALLVGSDVEDERLVLELATVELLELRLLDTQLEGQIEEAYQLLARRRSRWDALTVQRRELESIARMQADDALLHEGIDNALKLFGDDYLARLYRTAGRRFHFDDWDVSIQRKLNVLRTVYQGMADLAAHGRSEILEWIIILLIAVDIVLYFTPLR